MTLLNEKNAQFFMAKMAKFEKRSQKKKDLQLATCIWRVVFISTSITTSKETGGVHQEI